MSEFDAGAAPAAAEPSNTPSEAVVSTPNPIRTDPQPAAREPAKADAEAPKSSARDAIAKAREKVAEQEKAQAPKAVKSEPVKTEGKAEAKEPAKAETAKAEPQKQPAGERDEQGRYRAKEAAADAQQTQSKPDTSQEPAQPQKPRYEAPKRFSSDVAASADWEKTPESVQAAIHRVQREMEEGISKYKASHERYEPIREFDEIARKNGNDLSHSLKQVVAIEQAFARNPVEGFQRICDHFGINMRQIAAHIAGQKPEDVQVQQEGSINELRQQISRLEQQIGGVTTTIQSQQEQATAQQVEAFAKQPEHSRFYDLMEDVAFFLESNKVDQTLPAMDRLKAAYKLADRLNPDTSPKPANTAPASEAAAAKASDANSDALAEKTRKGAKSITGAPTAGADAVGREPSSSVKESLKRAFAQAG